MEYKVPQKFAKPWSLRLGKRIETLKFWKTSAGATSSKSYGINNHPISRLNLDLK
jgi:hypothetical protein